MPEQKDHMHVRFLASEEGSIFACGSCMLLLWIEAIVLLSGIGHALWDDLVTMALTHVTVGRAASIVVATHAGFAPFMRIFLSLYLDVMVMLIVYSLVVFSYKNLLEGWFLHKHVKSVVDSAKRSATRFRRFKIVGIFFFVWFPLSMTGIVVGSVLGFLLGLRTWVTMVTVVSGAASAILCWTYAADKLFDRLEGIDDVIPTLMTLMIILVLVVVRMFRRRAAVEPDTSESRGE